MFGSLVEGVQVGELEGRAGVHVAAEPLAHQLALAVGAEAVRRPERDEIGGRHDVSGRQPPARVQGAAARFDIALLRRQAHFHAGPEGRLGPRRGAHDAGQFSRSARDLGIDAVVVGLMW